MKVKAAQEQMAKFMEQKVPEEEASAKEVGEAAIGKESRSVSQGIEQVFDSKALVSWAKTQRALSGVSAVQKATRELEEQMQTESVSVQRGDDHARSS